MSPELTGEQFVRSPILYGDPATVFEVYGYDAEGHARMPIAKVVQQRETAGFQTEVMKPLGNKYMEWFRLIEEKARL